MATTSNISTNYVGEHAGKYIAPAILSGATLGNQLVTIKPNIAHSLNVSLVNINDIVKASTCDFDPTSTVTKTDKVLTPKKLQVNLQLCIKDYEDDWEAVKMGVSAWKTMPPDFQTFLNMRLAEKVSAFVETNIWTGIEASANQFGGFLPAFTADGDVIDVTGATAITKANVFAEIEKGYNAIPQALFTGGDELTLYVSRNVYAAYQLALSGFGTSGLGAAGVDDKGYTAMKAENFLSLKMELAPGLPNDTYVIARKENLWFGTGLMQDHNQVQIIDMRDIDGSQNFRYVMRFSAGVQYAYGNEIVFYDGRS
jgi:hypothetical protein